MNSVWNNIKTTYYIGKIMGLFPFCGTHKSLSVFYSLIIWISFAVTSVYFGFSSYVQNINSPTKHKLMITVKYLFYLYYFLFFFFGKFILRMLLIIRLNIIAGDQYQNVL